MAVKVVILSFKFSRCPRIEIATDRQVWLPVPGEVLYGRFYTHFDGKEDHSGYFVGGIRPLNGS